MTVNVIILAAGIGSRLAPISTTMPKSLTKVAGKEIIEYQIDGYIGAGIQEENITVVAGYMSDVMVDFLERTHPRIKVIINPDYNATNNMYSLYLALGELDTKATDVLFINNADCVYDKQIISSVLQSSRQNLIATEVGTHNDESMKVVADSSGKLVDIAKTIKEDQAYGLSIDLYKFSTEAVASLYDVIKDYIEGRKDLGQWTEVAFPKLFQRAEVYPHDIQGGRWFEIDNLEDLAKADKLFAKFQPAKKKAYILDLDGTVYIGADPIQPAVDWIAKNYDKYDFYFLTNNTSHTPLDYVDRLASFGITVTADRIATPLLPLSEYIEQQKLESVFLVANDKVTTYMRDRHPNVSFDYDQDKNQAVILTYDDRITYDKLRNACILLNNKQVEYIATHTDVFCPTPQGGIPDIGSYIALIKSVTNQDPSIVFGKPNSRLVQLHIDQYGAEKLAIAGDRLYTDKVLADNAGIDYICVLSGETTRYDVATTDFSIYPALVVNNLGELE